MTFQSRAKNSLLCPHCRRLISRDEKTCPYCGMHNPGARWKSGFLVSMLRDSGQFVRLIITVNVIMYVLSLLILPRQTGYGFSPFSFLSPSNRSLLLLGSTGLYPVLGLHRWWTLLSANYLHGSLLHILFNMLALWQLGPLAVREFGSWRMFSIYTLGGIFGFVVSVLARVPFTIGASAAICGLLGALLYFGKSRGGHYGNAVYSQLIGWVIGIFAFGFMVQGINNWGHAGGMAAGVLLGFLFGYQEKRREGVGDRILGICCMAATVLVLLWAVLTSLLYLFLG